jgi:hypothetical protein
MFIARWQIDAKFGHKDQAIEQLRKWEKTVGKKAGLPGEFQYLTGSVGALEARVEANLEVASLAELENFFAAIAKVPEQKKWAEALEPHVVSGTSRWEILRVL